jgi:hypothetical protein
MLALFLLLLASSKNLGSKPAIVIFSAALATLHLYDHVFLVKRRKENYCGACKM